VLIIGISLQDCEQDNTNVYYFFI